MNSLAEEKRCFVVYPEQSASANCAKCWNWFNQHDQQRNQGEPAIIAGIAREVIAAYGIDASQVFIVGLSAGGAMAVIMGRTYPDLFKAVGSHSGLPYASARDACSALAVMSNGAEAGSLPRASVSPNRMPVIVFQGDHDTTVHPSNGAGIIAQSLTDARACGNLTESLVQLQEAIRQGETTGRAYTHKVHRDAAGETLAEEWIVHGAGHAWSGGNVRGTYTDAHGPDAGTEMMRFFLPGRALETI
jgi:poly(hydroxyalkanoate) depolymerase family esterase